MSTTLSHSAADPSAQPRSILWRRFQWPIMIALAVLEGAIAGGIQGGAAGAMAGSIYAAIVGPVFLLMAWTVRRRGGHFWQAVLLGATIEALGALVIGVGARNLGGWFLQLVLITGIMVLGTLGPLVISLGSCYVCHLESQWATRGAVLGCILGAIPGAVFAIVLGIQRGAALPTLAISFFVLTISTTLIGAYLGAMSCATTRVLFRWAQRLRIRRSSRRARQSSNSAECPGGLNLEDVEHFAAEPASHQHLIRTLLEAIGDGAETLAFEPLGQICSLKRRVAGQMLETIPLPVPAHDVGLVLAGFSRGAMDEREKLWVAELPLQLAQAVQSASLRISTKNDVVVGTVRLPRGERISLQARRLLRDFADFIGEQWNMPCQVTVLCRQARPEAAGKDPERWNGDGMLAQEAELHLEFEPHFAEGIYWNLFLQVELDGETISEGPLAAGFSFTGALSPGHHLLHLTWTLGKRVDDDTFCLLVKDSGSYEVRLWWSYFWGGFVPRIEVTDPELAAEKAASGGPDGFRSIPEP